jgi:hypothetical protein
MLSECRRASMPWASNVSDVRFVDSGKEEPSAVGVYAGGGFELIGQRLVSGFGYNESDLSNAPSLFLVDDDHGQCCTPFWLHLYK